MAHPAREYGLDKLLVTLRHVKKRRRTRPAVGAVHGYPCGNNDLYFLISSGGTGTSSQIGNVKF